MGVGNLGVRRPSVNVAGAIYPVPSLGRMSAWASDSIVAMLKFLSVDATESEAGRQ
jgi:hypothetical protein